MTVADELQQRGIPRKAEYVTTQFHAAAEQRVEAAAERTVQHLDPLGARIGEPFGETGESAEVDEHHDPSTSRDRGGSSSAIHDMASRLA
ncbi:MAG: hypothetical protein IPL07_06380 [Acidimicrobiaceae bacterium]|nr:hypothetical protein [Acidimicrobiaceae bacterium]